MKSVLYMFIIYIGFYIIVSSGVLNLFAQKTFLRIAFGSVIFMLILTAALVGTPYSKPLIKTKRREKDEKDK